MPSQGIGPEYLLLRFRKCLEKDVQQRKKRVAGADFVNKWEIKTALTALFNDIAIYTVAYLYSDENAVRHSKHFAQVSNSGLSTSISEEHRLGLIDFLDANLYCQSFHSRNGVFWVDRLRRGTFEKCEYH